MKNQMLMLAGLATFSVSASGASDHFKIHCTMDTSIRSEKSYRDMVAILKERSAQDSSMNFGGFSISEFAVNAFNVGQDTVDIEYSKTSKSGTVKMVQSGRGPYFNDSENENSDKILAILSKHSSYDHLSKLYLDNRATEADAARFKEEVAGIPKKLGWKVVHKTDSDSLPSDLLCFPQTKPGHTCVNNMVGIKKAPGTALVITSTLGRFSIGKDPTKSSMGGDPMSCHVVEGDLLLTAQQADEIDADFARRSEINKEKRKHDEETNDGADLPVLGSPAN